MAPGRGRAGSPRERAAISSLNDDLQFILYFPFIT
jgi:hypothetical protein